MSTKIIDTRNLFVGDVVEESFMLPQNGSIQIGSRSVKITGKTLTYIAYRDKQVEVYLVSGHDPSKKSSQNAVRWIATDYSRWVRVS